MSEDQMLCKLAEFEAKNEILRQSIGVLSEGLAKFEHLYNLEKQKVEEVSTESEAYKQALETLIRIYDNEHPIRTADFHMNCNCNRCQVDHIRHSFSFLKR